jgi:hypothetical protein
VTSPSNSIHLDLGTTEEYYGIPWSVVPANQPEVTIEYGTDGADYSDESDPEPMPIPLNAPIEGGSNTDPNPSSGDRHVLVIQQGSCMLYDLYNAVRTATGFRVSSSAKWDLNVNATRYGLILADRGSAWYVTGSSDPAWEDALDQLRANPVHGSDFEVLESGAMTSC